MSKTLTTAEKIEAARAAHPFTPHMCDVGRRIMTVRTEDEGASSFVVTIHEMISNFDGEYGVVADGELMVVTPAWEDAKRSAVAEARKAA